MVDDPPERGDDDTAKAQERRRLLRRLAVVGPIALGLLVVLLLACVLWIPRWLYPPLTETDLHGVSDAAKVQELKDARLQLENDARTTLLQGLAAVLVLTGAAIGAAVTLRQIRISQGQLQATREQLQHTREQMQHTLETTHQQLNLTEQGQVTDRYTRAVEQLGHQKAPVRLGALYSLEHLAQDNPNYHQTVVDVVCAYLRMPYTPPAQPEPDAEQVQGLAPPANGRDRAVQLGPGGDPAREELQVRQTAQRLLADHLRRPPETSGQEAQLLSPSSQQSFWPGISLDLTGATLVDFGFEQVSVVQALFDGATFQGDAGFREATFQGDAEFDEASFQGDAWFGRATCQGVARFGKASFQGDAWFREAIFQRPAAFDRVSFEGTAAFYNATFLGRAVFSEATFQGTAGFDKATFWDCALFGRATFEHVAVLSGTRSHNGDRYDVWPDGWAVRPDPTDPSRGTLVKG